VSVKIDVSKSFGKNLNKAILKSIKEHTRKNGIDITCPTCDKEINVKSTNPKCKHCGTTFDLKF
jgi:ribosomal protein L37AE/L43A